MNTLSKNSKAIMQSLGLSNKEIYKNFQQILLDFRRSGSGLDFGVGQGRFLKILSELGFDKITGADLMDLPEWI